MTKDLLAWGGPHDIGSIEITASNSIQQSCCSNQALRLTALISTVQKFSFTRGLWQLYRGLWEVQLTYQTTCIYTACIQLGPSRREKGFYVLYIVRSKYWGTLKKLEQSQFYGGCLLTVCPSPNEPTLWAVAGPNGQVASTAISYLSRIKRKQCFFFLYTGLKICYRRKNGTRNQLSLA